MLIVVENSFFFLRVGQIHLWSFLLSFMNNGYLPHDHSKRINSGGGCARALLESLGGSPDHGFHGGDRSHRVVQHTQSVVGNLRFTIFSSEDIVAVEIGMYGKTSVRLVGKVFL